MDDYYFGQCYTVARKLLPFTGLWSGGIRGRIRALRLGRLLIDYHDATMREKASPAFSLFCMDLGLGLQDSFNLMLAVAEHEYRKEMHRAVRRAEARQTPEMRLHRDMIHVWATTYRTCRTDAGLAFQQEIIAILKADPCADQWKSLLRECGFPDVDVYGPDRFRVKV